MIFLRATNFIHTNHSPGSGIYVDLTNFTTGLCDRLRVLTLAVSFAKREGITYVHYDEVLTQECPYKIEELITFHGFTLMKGKPHGRFRIIKIDPKHSLPCFVNTLRFSSSLSLSRNIELLADWRAAYQLLAPPAGLESALQHMKFKFGVHIRAGDKLSNEKRLNQISRHEIKGFIHEFVPNLLSSIPKDEIPNIYIASESQESYEELKKNLDGCRVFPADRDWRQHGCRATNGQAVLEDIFYLAACNRIYTTLGGGVPLTAYYVSSQQVRVTKYINTFSFRSIYCIFSSVLRRLKRMVN